MKYPGDIHIGSYSLNIPELWLRLFGAEELVQRKIHVELAIGQLD